MASDTAALAGSCARETGAEVVLERYNSFREYAPAKVRARAEFAAKKLAGARSRARLDVALAGFDDAAEGLRRLLESRGVQAEAAEGRDFYRVLRCARLRLLARNDAVLSAAFTRSSLGYLVAPPPYGLRGTDGFLAAVGSALGRSLRIGPEPETARAAGELRGKLRRYKALFVLRLEEIAALAGGAVFRGVPVARVAAEAGLGIRLLVKADGPETRVQAGKAAAALGRACAVKMEVSFFSSPEALSRLLAADPAARLVYSDIRRDARAVRAGKTPFSRASFRPGYDGAVETARRLLRLCELEFDKRYGTRLGL